MSILVAIVSHQFSPTAKPAHPDAFGFRALKPAIAVHPQFLEMLVSRLSSTDHGLTTNALQLINSLMRDAIMNGPNNEWPKFVKRLQDLGVIRAVYILMQSPVLQDLAQPLIEFQGLTKVLLRKWRDVEIDFDKMEHRRAIRVIWQASKSDRDMRTSDTSDYDIKTPKGAEKWNKLGFRTKAPSDEFEEVGFLGMMDLSDFVRRSEDGFQKLILEQSTQPVAKRCPVATASIAITSILCDHFEIEKSELDDAKSYLVLDSRSNIDKLFSPMLLQWSRIHTAGVQAYFRIWKAAGADVRDLDKMTELIRILLEAVVGGASRTKEIAVVEDEILNFDLPRLRELQMELLELAYEDSWGQHLRQVRDELSHESLQFVKEQRVRCLLAGSWFPLSADDTKFEPVDANAEHKWRYVRLSHNRRFLHYANFEIRESKDPALADLAEKIDLSSVASVISNITQTNSTPASSTETLHPAPPTPMQPSTRIAIQGLVSKRKDSHSEYKQHHHRKTSSNASQRKEVTLLTLYPLNQTLACEWLDGLLMLMDQKPITPETNKLLKLVSSWGLKIRLLNVRFEEGHSPEDSEARIPSREGLDDDYYYEAFGTG